LRKIQGAATVANTSRCADSALTSRRFKTLQRRAPARRTGRAEKEKRMRKIVIATLIAAGIGLVGVSAGSATPVSGTALQQIAAKSNATIQVQWHHRHRCHGPHSRWWWCR
jgi:hypothetical protein